MQWIHDCNVSIDSDRGEVPNGHAAGEDDEEEAEQAPVLDISQPGGHVEGEVKGQGESHHHVGHGQRQDKHVGDYAAQFPAVLQRQDGESIAGEDAEHEQDIDNGPEDDVRLDGEHSVTGGVASGRGFSFIYD